MLTTWALVVATGSSATATQGQAVIAGQPNTETNVTLVNNTNTNVTCTVVKDVGLIGCGAAGVEGFGPIGLDGIGTTTGVSAYGDTTGVYTTSLSGTDTYASSTGGEAVVGQSTYNNGVHGLTNSATTSGVWGENEGGGYGVSGSTNGSGTAGVWGSNSQFGMGVKGTSASGIGVYASGGGAALQVVGKALFSRSGKATVPTGTSQVKVTGVALTSASLVLATIQGDVAGTWVRGVTTSVGTSSFTILLNKVVAANTKVAWFVVN